MSGNTYKVVVKDIVEGLDREEVKRNIAALYKNDFQKAEVFFKGKPVVIRKGLDQQSAMKYKKAFEKAGAVITVTMLSKEPVKTSTITGSNKPNSAKIKTITCPKCGFEQEQSDSCVKCGIAEEKYKKTHGQEESTGGDQNSASHEEDQMLQDSREVVVFLEELPKVFAYPFVGGGSYVVLAGLLFFLFIKYIPFIGSILWLIGTGCYCAYMIKVINSSADGDPGPPDWPGFSDFGTDIIEPLLKIVWAFVACYIPAAAYLYFVSGVAGLLDPFLWVLVILGSMYYPMALLTVAMSGNFFALNPLVVIPAIIRAPLDYFICLVAFSFVVGLSIIAKQILAIPIPLLGPAIQIFLTIYFMIIEMRMLGLLYNANDDKFGWYT